MGFRYANALGWLSTNSAPRGLMEAVRTEWAVGRRRETQVPCSSLRNLGSPEGKHYIPCPVGACLRKQQAARASVPATTESKKQVVPHHGPEG